jgi:hypothetical protein
MNNLAKSLFHSLVVVPIRHIRFATRLNAAEPVTVTATLIGTLFVRAVNESADYVQAHMTNAFAFASRMDLWDHAMRLAPKSGLLLEFGVHKGESLNHLARVASRDGRQAFGFDSFEGLKDDWPGLGTKKGHFDVGGALPIVEPNVTLVKGWFDETLPGFIEQHPDNAALIHIDCDTYQSTKTVLEILRPRLFPGAVIIFDEYFGYHGWRNEEYKAWQEFVALYHLNYEYSGFSERQVCLIIK